MTSPQPDQNPLEHARSLQRNGDLRGAESWLRQAITRDPDQLSAWMQLGQLLLAKGQMADAVEAFLIVAERDPCHIPSRSALGHLFRNQSMPDAAIHWHREAQALQPDELILNLNHLFVLPIVPSSSIQLEQLRQRALEGLEGLMPQQNRLRYGNHSTTHHPYYLIYHNRNDRNVLESYGALMQRWATSTEEHTPIRRTSDQAHTTKRRLRIGFLSGFFFHHSNSFAFGGTIKHLDRSHFEVTVIHLHGSKVDDVTEQINACADKHVTLPSHYLGALRTLRSLELDLLYFTDIGMHPMSTLLASSRSAPIQITGWGVPQTSGLPNIDYYISGTHAEPVNAGLLYSERLILLPGLPCCYESSNLIATKRDRSYFFLPEESLLLGCPQNFSKLHPDFDPILEEISRHLPDAWFVFVESEITSHTSIFLDRIATTAPTLRDRLILLTRQSRADFIALAGCLDLLLDPPYFSSGITLYDTIHTGTPIVCLEGRFLRSRYVAGAYRLMELPDPPVARSPEDYVELAVRLGRDRPRREALRQELRDRSHLLYDRREVVDAFGDFALEAIARAAREVR